MVRLQSIKMMLSPALLVAMTTLVQAQSGGQLRFKSRNDSTRSSVTQNSSGAVTAGSQAVSNDLMAIYQQTKAAQTEPQVTAIARACAEIIPNQARSKTDREYASSLLAWALNRRGEMRSERAAELVQSGQLQAADALDRQAAEDFATSIEYGPKNWRTHHNYAISLAMKGDYPAAIRSFTTAIKLNPSYANSHFNRGELYFEVAQYEKALRDYEQAISLNDQDPQYFNSRGHCHFMMESYDDGLADYRQAASLGSDSSVYHTDLADAYQFMGSWESAAKAYRAAIASNNKYARAYQNAAWLMATCPNRDIRNPELALAAAEKAIELGEGRTSRTLDTLAAATAAAGKFKEAAQLQRQAINLMEDRTEAAELNQRLALYQRQRTYQQPSPLADAQPIESDNIRTASGSIRADR